MGNGKRQLEVVVAGNAQGATDVAQQVEHSFNAMSAGLAGGMFAAGQAVFGIVEQLTTKILTFATDSAKVFEDEVLNASKVSRLTGESIEDASKLEFAAQQTGIGVDVLNKGLGVFAKALDRGKVDEFTDSLGDETAATVEQAAAQQKLADANDRLESMQHAAAQAGQHVVDAQQAVADAAQRSADAQAHVGEVERKVADQNKAYEDSLQKIVDAQHKVTDAQKNLDEVLNGGQHGNDYEIKKEQATLNQRAATDALADAQDRLAKATTPAERERAQLEVDRARLDVMRAKNDVADSNLAQTNDATAARTKLQEAEDAVTAAQDQSTKAAQAVADAEGELQKAAQSVTSAHNQEARAVRGVAEANWQYVEAQKAVAKEQEKVDDLTSHAQEALDKMGIAVRDSNGNLLPTTEILGNVAEKFHSMPDGFDKTALSMQLFGRTAGPEMEKLLNKGRDGMQAVMDKADEFGLVFTDADAKSAAAAKQAERDQSAAWKGLQVTFGREVLPVLTDVERWFTKKMPDAIKGLKAWFDEHRKDIEEWREKIVGIFNWLDENVPHIVNTVMEYWGYFQNGLDQIRPILNAVWALFEEGWNQFQVGIQVIGWIGDKIGAFINWVTDTAWPAIQRFGGGIHDVFFAVKDAVTDAWNWVWDKTESVIGFFTGLPDRISNAVSGMWDGVKESFRNVLNWIIWKWNSFSITLPSVDIAGQHFGGQTLQTPQIPYLHTGGIYTPPPGQSEGLAMLRGGERVSTPGSGGDGIHVHFHGPVFGNDRDIGEGIVGYLKAYRDGGGRLELVG